MKTIILFSVLAFGTISGNVMAAEGGGDKKPSNQQDQLGERATRSEINPVQNSNEDRLATGRRGRAYFGNEDKRPMKGRGELETDDYPDMSDKDIEDMENYHRSLRKEKRVGQDTDLDIGSLFEEQQQKKKGLPPPAPARKSGTAGSTISEMQQPKVVAHRPQANGTSQSGDGRMVALRKTNVTSFAPSASATIVGRGYTFDQVLDELLSMPGQDISLKLRDMQTKSPEKIAVLYARKGDSDFFDLLKTKNIVGKTAAQVGLFLNGFAAEFQKLEDIRRREEATRKAQEEAARRAAEEKLRQEEEEARQVELAKQEEARRLEIERIERARQEEARRLEIERIERARQEEARQAAELEKNTSAAIKIQAAFRGSKVRKDLKAQQEEATRRAAEEKLRQEEERARQVELAKQKEARRLEVERIERARQEEAAHRAAEKKFQQQQQQQQQQELNSLPRFATLVHEARNEKNIDDDKLKKAQEQYNLAVTIINGFKEDLRASTNRNAKQFQQREDAAENLQYATSPYTSVSSHRDEDFNLRVYLERLLQSRGVITIDSMKTVSLVINLYAEACKLLQDAQAEIKEAARKDQEKDRQAAD